MLVPRGAELGLDRGHGRAAGRAIDVGRPHLHLIVDYQGLGACQAAQPAAEQRERQSRCSMLLAFAVHGAPASGP